MRERSRRRLSGRVRGGVVCAAAVVVLAGVSAAAGSPSQTHGAVYRGHVADDAGTAIRLGAGFKNGRPRQVVSVSSGVIAMACEKGNVSKRVSLDPTFPRRVKADNSFVVAMTFENAKETSRDRMRAEGHLWKRKAIGHVRLFHHDPTHGDCHSGRLSFRAHR